MPGDLSGAAMPVYIPLITDIANIQNGLRNFYYGTASAVSDENSIEANSIAGRIKSLRDTKLNIDSPSATTKLTVSHATLPQVILKRDTFETTLQNNTAANITLTLPNTTGTIALTTESSMTKLSAIGGDSSVTSVTLGNAATSTYSIGTSPKTSGTKTINIGVSNDTVAKTISIGTGSSSSTTIVNVGTNSGGTSTINSFGTFNHTGAFVGSSSLQALSFTVGASGPTITSGSTVPSGSPSTGSVYLRTSQNHEATLYIRSTTASNWNAVRGSKWYSGTTDSPSFSDAQVGDFYLNRVNGKVFQFS